jgi:carboxypeptidase Q
VELGNNNTGSGADIQPLRRLGVPILSPLLDASLYFDVHHTANDTLDKVDPEHIRQSTAVFAVTAYLAAMEPELPERLPPPPSR